MITLFTYLTTSAIFGVDFGSDSTKLGIALPGRIEIALNQQSKRYTPSFFSICNRTNKAKTVFPDHWTKKNIRDLEWSFAYEAQSQNRRFPQNVVRGLPNLLGSSHGLTGREQTALILKNLISTAADGKFPFDKSTLIFAVDPSLSRQERYALTEATKIGESNCAGIVDSPTAAATTYALERQGFYMNSSRTVALLDFGQEHTWVSIFNFTSNGTNLSAEQLGVVENATLGGRIADERIASLLMQKFAEQNKLEPPFSKRVQQRFIDEARRAKERLTVSPKTDIVMEDVIEEYCFEFVLTREEFEGLISDVADSLEHLLDEVLVDAKMEKDQLDSIELLGGVTRVPFVNETIRKWSGMEKLNRTMNSDEAIALGAGYVGASTSSSFIITKVNMTSFALCNASFHDENNNSYPLFTEHSKLTDTATVNFSIATLPKKIIMHVDGEGDFETFEVKLPNLGPMSDITSSDKVSLEFGFNEYTIPVLKKATVVYRSDLEIAEAGKADWMINMDKLYSGIGILHKMQLVLKKRIDFLKLMNDHESLIYKIRDRLDCDYELLEVLTEEEKANISGEVDLHQQWADDESKKKTKKIIRRKLRQLEELLEDPDQRVYEHKERPKAIKELNSTIKKVIKELKYIKKSKKWITEDNLTILREVLNSTSEWYTDRMKVIDQENITSNPVVLAADFNRRKNALQERLEKVLSIPKPKPVVNKTATNTTNNVNGSFVNGTDSTNQTTVDGTNSTVPELNQTSKANTTKANKPKKKANRKNRKRSPKNRKNAKKAANKANKANKQQANNKKDEKIGSEL